MATTNIVQAGLVALTRLNAALNRIDASTSERAAAKQFLRDLVAGNEFRPARTLPEKIAARALQAAAEPVTPMSVIAMLRSPELLEALADVEHERWSGWEKYREECVTKGSREGDTETHEQRWARLRATSYADLPESSKASDRVEARKSLGVVEAFLCSAFGIAPPPSAVLFDDGNGGPLVDHSSELTADEDETPSADPLPDERELTPETVVSVTEAGIELLKSWQGEWGPDQEQQQILRVVASHNLRSLSSLGVAVGMGDEWENVVPAILRCLNNGLLQVVE